MPRAKQKEEKNEELMVPLTRRDFLKLAAATAIMGTIPTPIRKIFAQAKDYVHILWLNGAGCTGCSVSLAQAADPDLVEVLSSITVGNSGLPIALPDWMYVVHPAAGSLAVELINDWIAHSGSGLKILVVEGSMQNEGFCETGGRDLRDWVKDSAAVADAIIAFGSCSSFGGIPSAEGNVTNAQSVQEYLTDIGMAEKAAGVINLPRCPGHPDSLILTLASVLSGIMPELDEYNRPTMFYGRRIHEDICPFRPFYDKGIFAEPGNSEEGCKFKIGCKGPITSADCPSRKWNDHTAFCIETGLCIGCAEPDWPDGEFAPFLMELPDQPALLNLTANKWGQIFLGATAVGAAVHLGRRAISRKDDEE